VAAAALLWSPNLSHAQSDFYSGKTITLVVGASAGGGYDLYARAIAPFLSAHVPGKPNVIVRNMPGAGGLTSVRYLDTGASKDGTVITTFNAGVLTKSFAHAVKDAINFNKLTWLGSLNRSFRFCYFWHGRGFATWPDLFGSKEATLGGIGVNSAAYNDIALLKNLMKAHVRAILGFPGRSEVHLAIERGEVDGECGSKEGIPENWFTDGKMDIVARMLESKSPEVPANVPWVGEFLKDRDDFDVLTLLTTAMELGRPYVMSGEIPADRVAILQKAFVAAARDPQFVTLADSRNMDLSLVTGPEAQQLLTRAYATPKHIADRAREIIK
jgi:tripartite-type tricarboxylate transporter receptor subunit TctC